MQKKTTKSSQTNVAQSSTISKHLKGRLGPRVSDSDSDSGFSWFLDGFHGFQDVFMAFHGFWLV